MNKKHRGYVIQILVLVFLIAFGLWRQQHRMYRETRQAFLMDTLFEIEAESRNSQLAAVLDSCLSLAAGYEQQLSAYAESGSVQRLNDSDGDSIIMIDDDILKLITTADYYYQQTGGRYDVTIGALADLWDFSKKRVPTEDEVKQALAKTGFDKVILHGNMISHPTGMKFNFGSIAKGYVVDRMKEMLHSNGIENMLINAGGDLYIQSDKPLLIGIQHPRLGLGEVIDELSIKNMAVVTSGDYERYFEVDGRRYHHIIDAINGYPADKCVAVTAICADATTADALSTSAFLLTPEEAVKMADKVAEAALIVYYFKDGELVRMTNDRALKYLEAVK
ncbi:MAG: FAD:protein FMN transferase [Candidatus Cloacimonetes bacterium]|nr:FAD:protein FMN transferase [Candidatus Cloacimonadota bacterium]